MSTISQFAGGFRSTTSILNYCSSGSVQVAGVNAAAANQAKEVLSGTLSAGVLATALSVSVPGEIGYLSVYTKDTTSRTVRIKVTVDGGSTAVFDATSSAITTANSGLIVVGALPGDSTRYSGNSIPLRWNTSLLVEIASSLGETDKIAIAYTMWKY